MSGIRLFFAWYDHEVTALAAVFQVEEPLCPEHIHLIMIPLAVLPVNFFVLLFVLGFDLLPHISNSLSNQGGQLLVVQSLLFNHVLIGLSHFFTD